jgi:hypothetical protein
VRNLISVLAVMAGGWLVYLGYVRQNSLAGLADGSISKLGQRIDGGDHTPAHVRYYVAGAVLIAGGVVGLARR